MSSRPEAIDNLDDAQLTNVTGGQAGSTSWTDWLRNRDAATLDMMRQMILRPKPVPESQ